MTAERCPHDVHPRACSTCRQDDAIDRHIAGTASRPFTARFDGVCRGCGFDIRAGEQVRYVDGDLAHAQPGGGCS